MRKARFAEWLLRSVTTPERAASTAGDLVESAPERGDMWFWSCLLRTVGAQMWRGVASNPHAMLWLVLRAWGMGFIYALGCRYLRAIADLISIAIQGHRLTGGLSWMTGMIGAITVQILMGRWIANQASEQGMSAGLALCVSAWVLGIGAVIVLLVFHLPGAPLTSQQWVAGSFQTLVWPLPFLAGAMMAASSRASEMGDVRA